MDVWTKFEDCKSRPIELLMENEMVIDGLQAICLLFFKGGNKN